MNFNGTTMSANYAGFSVPPVAVVVTENEDGTFSANRTISEILTAHDSGNIVYCIYKNMVLSLVVASKSFCSFGGIYDKRVSTVTVGISTVTATSNDIEDAIGLPEIASVGQTIAVQEVNAKGEPVKWAAVDFPTGGGGAAGGNNATLRHIATLVFDENTNASHWIITQDEDGNALSLSHVFIRGDVLAADRKGDGAFRINDEIAIPWCFSMQTNGYTAIMDITMAGTTALVRYMSWESSTKANRFEAYRGRGSSSVISSILCSNAAGVRIPSGSKFEIWGY